MSPAASSSATPAGTTDVLIVGGGPAGLSLAIALAQAGLRATVLEQQGAAALADPAPDGREIALTHPSVATLGRLGSWQHLAPHEIGLLRQAQVHDGPVGQREGMALNAQGTGCDNLGWIVPNHALRRTAWAVAAATAGVRLITGVKVTRVSTTPARAELEYVDAATPDATPQRLQAPLLVAADSRFSATRRQLGIGASMHDFGRTVVVCRLQHERAHDGIAHECFGYERTLAILPLPDDPDSGAPTCSAVVTAHGYNLGLAGVARLAQVLGEAHTRGADLGDAALLQSYARAHHRHAWPLYRGTNAIVGLYTDERPLPRLVRRAVLAGSSRLPPLKALIVSQLTGRRPAWPRAAG